MRPHSAVRLALAAVVATIGAVSPLLAAPGAPVLNNNQPVLTSGSTVTLTWTAPASGTPLSYLVEAAITPGGPALASINTGSTQTSLVAPGVTDGVYYVRVRGVDGSGAGAPSNEVQVIVGTIAVCPSAPRTFAASAAGGTVSLSWQAPASGTATSYTLQVGSAPGLADLLVANLGSALGFAAANVTPGTYYLRVLARGPACTAPAFTGPASNEVALTVGATALGAPVLNNNLPVQSSGPTLNLSWNAPASGVPTSYQIEAAATPGGAPIVSFNTGNALTGITFPGVPPGTYYVHVRGVNAVGPGPASNEVVLTVGTAPSWSGVIQCQSQISGGGYSHTETQRWIVGLPATPVNSARTDYTALWSATGSGGHSAATWTINQSRTITLSATVIASTQRTAFDRTTTGVVIPGGIVATPQPNFTLYEMDFPAITTDTPTSTLVTGTWSRPTVGGDSPQQPGAASGTLTCTWTLRLQ